MRKIFLIIFSLTHVLIYSQKSSQKDSAHNKTIDEIVNYGFQDILREGRNLDELKDNYLPAARLTLLYHEEDGFPLK